MNGSTPRALIVEDDSAMADVFQRCLVLWGWDAVQSHSLPSALALFERQQYDLVVCDVDLPGGDGIFLAKEIRKTRPGLHVVMVSGDPGNLDRARRNGLCAGLRKPFDLNDFKALVENARAPAGLKATTPGERSDAASLH